MTIFLQILLVWWIVCLFKSRHGSNCLGCFGSGNAQSSSSNPVTNQQAAAEQGIAVGGGGTNNQTQITVSDASTQALQLAQDAVDQTTVTQQSALSDVAGAITAASGIANTAIAGNAVAVQDALAANTVVASNAINVVGSTVASSETAFANLTAQALQSALQIAGNASPQTPAAAAEITGGVQPIGTTVTGAGATAPATTTGTTSVEEIMLIAVFVFGGFLLYKHSK